MGQLARMSQGLKMSDLNLIMKSVIFFEAHSPSNLINLLNEIIFTANQLKFFVTRSTGNKSFFWPNVIDGEKKFLTIEKSKSHQANKIGLLPVDRVTKETRQNDEKLLNKIYLGLRHLRGERH